MRPLMVQGTSSWAGKSLLATVLVRHFRRRGIKVAPFKAQNMSNNARVVADGEIGTAQYLQAVAAEVEPDVRMNPVLIKPEGDNTSQVVVLGKPDLALSKMRWMDRAPFLWAPIEDSLSSLLGEFDLVVMEGAGSPAEINLTKSDHANMSVARQTSAVVLMVADIDRGGAFAHLFGTWGLLPPSDRSLIGGFILNKFRGDPSLLAPAPEKLKELTGVPTIGVVPWLRHGLPDEDGAASPVQRESASHRVAIIRYPTASNLDEFKAFEAVVDMLWATEPSHLTGASLVILPGSKHVSSDLRWLKEAEFPSAIDRFLERGGRLLAICGGLQMLGQMIEDPGGVDGYESGLGILPLRTIFEQEKTTRRRRVRIGKLPEPWGPLSGLAFSGYEIRHGRTFPTGDIDVAIQDGLGFVRGPVLGIYMHGFVEEPEVVRAITGATLPYSLEETIDELTASVVPHLDLRRIETLVGVG